MTRFGLDARVKAGQDAQRDDQILKFAPVGTIAAMKDARVGKLESVTLDQLQAVLDADD